MELNQIDIHYSIAAICVISSALVFYTIGVWGERLQRKLKFWHIIFFLLGLLADTVGTSLMEHIAELTHLHDEMHTVTGAIAILLMFVHALWAIWTYVKGTPIEKRHFNSFQHCSLVHLAYTLFNRSLFGDAITCIINSLNRAGYS